MPIDVVLHGPSFSPTNPKVTPEAIADAVNPVIALKVDKSVADATTASTNVTIGQLQQANNSLTTSLASANTTIAALQLQQTAIAARVTVLETATPPPAVPNAVATFTLGATTNTTQVLAWTAPSGGVALTFYDTRYKLAGTATWSAGPSVAVGTLTATVTGLTSGANYDYSVVTRNAAGPGGASVTRTKQTTTTFTPSPAWTKIPPASSITMNNGDVVTVVSGVIYLTPLGGSITPMGDTNSVVLTEISNTGVIYQKNAFNDWWYWNSTTPWVYAADPEAPPPSPGVPAIAAAQGYNTLTFGPSVVTGNGWYVGDGTAVLQGDGAMRLISASGYNGGYATLLRTGGYMGFTGRAFGGGFYVRFTAKWSGAGSGGNGWPALWANDIEGQTGFDLSNMPIQYPGRANGSNLWFEPDVMEDQGNNANDYGSSLWLWSTEFAGVQSALQRKTFPGGFATRTSYHTYGWLWVPAKPGVRGYMAYCFDDVEYQRVVWDYRSNRSTLPSPPAVTDLGGNVALANVGSDIDWRHYYLEMGSGTTSPIDVLKVEVFQASTINNITQ